MREINECLLICSNRATRQVNGLIPSWGLLGGNKKRKIELARRVIDFRRVGCVGEAFSSGLFALQVPQGLGGKRYKSWSIDRRDFPSPKPRRTNCSSKGECFLIYHTLPSAKEDREAGYRPMAAQKPTVQPEGARSGK